MPIRMRFPIQNLALLPPRPRLWAAATVVGLLALLQPAPSVLTGVEPGSVGAAQDSPSQSRGGEAYIPVDLEDCFVELRRRLSQEVLRDMRDAKEQDMLGYHHGLGTGLRNDWGLWRGSRLSAYFNRLGIQHPDDMSGIILTSFWRHLHEISLDVEGQVVVYRDYWARARHEQALEAKRVERLKAALPGLMMGLKVAEDTAAVLTLPERKDGGLPARHGFVYRGAALLTVRKGEDGGEAFRLEPYFLDLKRMSLRPVRLPEIDTLSSAIVLGQKACFLGRRRGTPRLLCIAENERRLVALPRVDSLPQLGLEDDRMLVVYPNSIYRLDNSEWRAVYAGSVQLPWSGPPPLRVGGRVYFRDEGENDKRLWWLDLQNPDRLASLDTDCGMVGSEGPRWETVGSYAASPNGGLWAAVGTDLAGRSLLRRAPDGTYQIAVMNGKLAFDGNLLGNDGDVDASAVAWDGIDTLLAAGRNGLYRIHPGRIEPVVSFANTNQEIPVDKGKFVYHWNWEPTHLLDLGEEGYVIGGMFGGIYLLRRQPTGTFALVPLDESVGAPIEL